MALFKKRIDPINDRSRALKAEIAALENEIRQLNARIENPADSPRVRSTALPASQGPAPATPAAADPREPVFEKVDHKKVSGMAGTFLAANPALELGLRKSAGTSVWRRFKDHFRSTPASNPKLVSYLAAGSIKGLRPMRYEKRVARNRFLMLTGLLLLLFWGVYAVWVRTN